MAWIEPDVEIETMASIYPNIENSLKMHQNQHSGMAIEFGRTHTTPPWEKIAIIFFYNHQKFTMAKPKPKTKPNQASNFWFS